MKAYPELKGTDLVKEPCGRCGGRGNIGYGNVASAHYKGGARAQTCFDCFGKGEVLTKVSTIRARETRRAKAEARRKAEAAERAAQAAAQAAVEEAERHAKEAAEAERIANTPPIEAGRHTVTGEIVGVRSEEQAFGYRTTRVYKMMVKDAEGRKFWGSMPRSIVDAVFDRWHAETQPEYGTFGPDTWLRSAKGSTVTFTATVEVSHDDPTFGFFSRPTRAALVAAEEVVG